MSKNLLFRILLDLIVLLMVMHGWWLVSVILLFLGIIYFNNFFEIIIFGLIFDAMFGFDSNLGIFGYIGTIFSVITYCVFYFLKTVLRK
jgi:hypothetical protein